MAGKSVRSNRGRFTKGGRGATGDGGNVEPVVATAPGPGIGEIIGGDTNGADGDVTEYRPTDRTAGDGDSSGDGAGAGTASGAARRGRPPGSKSAFTKRKTVSQDLESLEALLFSTHLMLAALVDNADLALKEGEAKKLAESLERVKAFYPVNFNPKLMAWFHLTTTAAGIYGPRLLLVLNTPKKKPGPVPVEMPRQTAPSPAPKTNGAPQVFTPSELNREPPAEDEHE